MWKVQQSDRFIIRRKLYEKKRPKELEAVIRNLRKYSRALQESEHPQLIKFGSIHNEKKGVLALDQGGSKESLQETRLYLYPDFETKTLHLITIGNKNQQKHDIAFCHRYIKDLKNQN